MRYRTLIRLVAFIGMGLLFLAAPLYAKIQPISDENLGQINAEAGINLGLNVNAQINASSVALYDGTGKTEGIVINSLNIGDGTTKTNPFNLNTTMDIDVGTDTTTSTLHLLRIGGLVTSNANGIGISSGDIQILSTGDTTRTIGALNLTGLHIGQTLNAISPIYEAAPVSYIQIKPNSATGRGIRMGAEMGGYISSLMLDNTTNDFTVSGIYISEFTYGWYDASGNPSDWNSFGHTGMYGNAIIGSAAPILRYDGTGLVPVGYMPPASVDVFTTGTTQCIYINQPMALTAKISNMTLGGKNLGSSTIDNFWAQRMEINILNYTWGPGYTANDFGPLGKPTWPR